MTKFKAKMIAIAVAVLLIAVFTAVSFAAWNKLNASEKITVETGSTTTVTIDASNSAYGNTKKLVPNGEVMNSDEEATEITLSIPVAVTGNHKNVTDLTCAVTQIKLMKAGKEVTIDGQNALVSVTTQTGVTLDAQGKATIVVTINNLYNDASLADCTVEFLFSVTANAVKKA